MAAEPIPFPLQRRMASVRSSVQQAEDVIRPYMPSDREAIRRICCDTAFFGSPIDPIFCDRDLYADLMTAPYIDDEPEWAWTVEREGEVMGYLIGSADPHFERRQIRHGFNVTRKMLARLLAGRYSSHPRSRQYIRWLLTRAGRERPRRPRGAAHLHFNLLDSERGGNVGRRMWNTFARRLEKEGITCCYGEFFSCRGRRLERVYSRYGFSVYDRRETTAFSREINEKMEMVCVVKRVEGSDNLSWTLS